METLASRIDPASIIRLHYPERRRVFHILMAHSKAVAEYAVQIAQQNAHLGVDLVFLYEAAMLHDIGIIHTRAESIDCRGKHPYICHGYLGHEMLEKMGLPNHAKVCERHTGAGLSLEEILEQNLPLPHRHMLPVTIEEKLICYADKFFSKSGALYTPKPIDRVRADLRKFGPEQWTRFNQMHALFEE